MELPADGRTPYDILEIKDGPAATEADIRKAYKLLALKKHPDKNKDNPNAAAEFGELEKAYRVLSDASARGALDDYLAAKAARVVRQAGESDKRRRMREELERREREVTVERSEEAVARSRLAQELERLRRKLDAEAQAASAAAAAAAAAAAPTAELGGQRGPGDDDDMQEQLRRTLKVTWDPGTRGYSSAELRAVFAVHGEVVDVVVKEAKGRSKSGAADSGFRPGRASKVSALVVMATQEGADRAVSSVNGDVSDPFLVVPLMKVAPPPGQHTVGVATPLAPAPQPLAPGRPVFPVTGAAPIPAVPPAMPLFPSARMAPLASTQRAPPSAAPSGFGSFPGLPARLGAGEDAVLQRLQAAAQRQRGGTDSIKSADPGTAS